jgi:hypothetical protein
MKFLAASLTVMMALVLTLGNNKAGEKPKYTIKEVMKKAHVGDKLMAKVASGKADDSEKMLLAELYKALSQNTPPKGDADDWKKKTTALVDASSNAAKGDEKAAATLPKLANCMACHKEHKK